MRLTPFFALALTVTAVAVPACGGDDDTGSPTATATATATSTTTTTSSGGNTAAVVKAATAFLATLDSDQKGTATLAFDDQQAKSAWSNFPVAIVPRQGLAYADMTEQSAKAADALAEAVLSDSGYRQFQNIRQADEYLNQLQSSGQGGGPGGGDQYGADKYYVAIFGTPSKSDPFMVAFNGHHMAYNMTYNAAEGTSASPSFTGVEPATFQSGDQTTEAMKTEADAAFGLLKALPDDAKLSASYDDLLLGPGEDGKFPAKPQGGVKVTDLDASARKLVDQLVAAYAGDIDESQSASLIAAYEKDYSQTYVAWADSKDPDDANAYLRLDGPQVWIEFSNQNGIVVQGKIHYHTVYRDQTRDYGGS